MQTSRKVSVAFSDLAECNYQQSNDLFYLFTPEFTLWLYDRPPANSVNEYMHWIWPNQAPRGLLDFSAVFYVRMACVQRTHRCLLCHMSHTNTQSGLRQFVLLIPMMPASTHDDMTSPHQTPSHTGGHCSLNHVRPPTDRPGLVSSILNTQWMILCIYLVIKQHELIAGILHNIEKALDILLSSSVCVAYTTIPLLWLHPDINAPRISTTTSSKQ